ncbi:MAG TPA: GNAT family N-acetyltransferase [Ktedonobacteraceae bacterium]|jgi:ribosomal protein S18 acetylase RimI-like enzyme|nr:GNAT family N-acetyltransferase [Ktedonobacteraceae bacterium]
MHAHIALFPASEDDLSAIVALWQAQDRRHYAQDPLLYPPRSAEQIEQIVRGQRQHEQSAFVALDDRQRVRAYIAPACWNLAPTSVLHAFLTPCNGIAEAFVLPDPDDADVAFVVSAVCHFLSTWWRERKTTGDLLRWPACDRWLEPFLLAQGFLLDSVCAIRSPVPLEQPVHSLREAVTIRLAVPADEEQLLALFLAEMEVHANTVPCSRVSEVAMRGFAHKLQQYWQEGQEQGGDLFILVAEHPLEGVVGMAENVLITVEWDEAPGFTPPGRYGCLDNVSVRPGLQGLGIGRLLVDAALTLFRQRDAQMRAVVLWYNPDNPRASRFWPHLGFHDLWMTYQRLSTP